MSEEKINGVESVVDKPKDLDSLVEKPELDRPTPKSTPDKEQFDSLVMEQKKAPPVQEPTRGSLMDTVRDLNTNAASRNQIATPATLVSQTQEAITQIDKIKKTLEGPDVGIKLSAQKLLHNKLTHIDEGLRIALSRAGVEYSPTEAPVASQRVNPIERFLGFLTDGQHQLQNLGQELAVMGQNGKEISPVNMLAIQVKVGYIQQELELFSNLLNKGLESIKTIMNIQV